VWVHLSNRFGTAPVLMGHVTVAVSAHAGGRRDGTIDASDDSASAGGVRDVLFAGGARTGAGPTTSPPGWPVAGAGLRRRQLRDQRQPGTARSQRSRTPPGFGATIMAWKGWGAWTPELETTRTAVNAWIRAGGGGSLDAIADFDAVTRDPADPQRMLPAYDSGDHLHPNDAGDRAMAAVIPLGKL
jgi:hypothetical protein